MTLTAFYVPSTDTSVSEEEGFPFLGILNASEIAQQQRDDLDLLLLIHRLQGFDVQVSCVFFRGLTSFCLPGSVLHKRNVEHNGEMFLLVVPTSMREEILYSCHDDPTRGHMGVSRVKHYWPNITSINAGLRKRLSRV